MKKICLLIGFYPIIQGGAEYQAYLLAQELQKKANVFYLSVGHDKDEVFYQDGFKIYGIKRPPLRHFGNAYFVLKNKIIKVLSIERPEYIYQRICNSLTGIASCFCKRHKSKMIWHIANDPDVMPFKHRLNRFVLVDYIEKRMAEYGIKNCDFIVAQTEYQHQQLNINYGRSCTLVVPNFHPVPKHTTPKTLPIKVVWAANIKKKKQPGRFLDLCTILDETRSVEFIMIGKHGPRGLQKVLDRRISQLSTLSYRGQLSLERVNRVLETSQIFVNTSLHEGFPNTFIQAWMRKVPVVSLNVDPDNILKRNAIGFHSGTFEQLVKDTRQLINDGQLRERMGNKAQEIAFERFTLKNREKIIKLID